jgi:hypothetical protein
MLSRRRPVRRLVWNEFDGYADGGVRSACARRVGDGRARFDLIDAPDRYWRGYVHARTLSGNTAGGQQFHDGKPTCDSKTWTGNTGTRNQSCAR